jgi:hypothetical protein
MHSRNGENYLGRKSTSTSGQKSANFETDCASRGEVGYGFPFIFCSKNPVPLLPFSPILPLPPTLFMQPPLTNDVFPVRKVCGRCGHAMSATHLLRGKPEREQQPSSPPRGGAAILFYPSVRCHRAMKNTTKSRVT